MNNTWYTQKNANTNYNIHECSEGCERLSAPVLEPKKIMAMLYDWMQSSSRPPKIAEEQKYKQNTEFAVQHQRLFVSHVIKTWHVLCNSPQFPFEPSQACNVSIPECEELNKLAMDTQTS
jgi:hypothetical protein